MFILHYIMECVGNLYSPCPLHEQPKRKINLYISRLCKGSATTITCVPNSFSIRRKHFAGNFSPCVNIVKETFVEASKVVDKPSL